MTNTERRHLAGILALAAAASCVTASGIPNTTASAETTLTVNSDYVEGTDIYYDYTRTPEMTTTASTTTTYQEDFGPINWYEPWEDFGVEDDVRYASVSEKYHPSPRLVVRECQGDAKTIDIPNRVIRENLFENYIGTVIGVEYDGTTVKAGEGTRQRHLILPENVSWASFYDFSAGGMEDDPANYYDLFTVLTFRNPKCDIRIPNIGQIRQLLLQDGLTLTIRGFAGSTAEAFAKKNGLPFENLQITAGDLTYEVRDGNVIVNGYHGESTSLTIPAEIDGMPVTGIAKSAFESSEVDSKLERVTLPDSIKEIGESAFWGCHNLTSITIPDGVEVIERGTFEHCYKLKDVRLPDSLKRIERAAFDDCNSLTEIVIPDGCEEIGAFAFSCCDLDAVRMPDSVTLLGEGAFSHCGYNLSEVHLSAGLTEIPECAFSNTGVLDSVEIPAGVKKIGCEAFGMLNNLIVRAADCEFDEEFMEQYSSPTIYGFRDSTAQALAESRQMIFKVLDSDETIRPDYEKNLTFRVENNKAYVTGLSDETPHLIIPAEYAGCPVAGIDANAFSGHFELKSVEIPDTVTEIGSYAFSECGLNSVRLPENLTDLQDGVFSDCYELRSVVLPKNLTRIGKKAFYDNYLTSIVLPDGLTEIGDEAFYGNQITECTVPDTVKTLGNSVFAYCWWLSSVKLPEGITRIGSCMFNMCSNLTEYSVPDTVTEIGEGAFYMSGIRSITLPESLTAIAPNTFGDCYYLTQINIPKNVTTIGSQAFYNTRLKEVTLPASVQKAGYGAFASIPNALKLTVLNPDCEMQECFGRARAEWDQTSLGEEIAEWNLDSCICGEQDSSAHAYANWLGVRFYDLDGNEITKKSTRVYEPSNGDEEWNYTGIAGTTDWWHYETETTTYSESGTTCAETNSTDWHSETETIPYYEYETTCAETTTTTTQTTVTATATSTVTSSSETTPKHIAADDVLCDWAVNDYQLKTGVSGIHAEITSVSDDLYEITLTDENGNLADVYTVDPATGIGTDTDDKPVNLPQTGNNKLTRLFTMLAAFTLTGFGWLSLRSSGIIRRNKKDQNA